MRYLKGGCLHWKDKKSPNLITYPPDPSSGGFSCVCASQSLKLHANECIIQSHYVMFRSRDHVTSKAIACAMQRADWRRIHVGGSIRNAGPGTNESIRSARCMSLTPNQIRVDCACVIAWRQPGLLVD